MIAQKACNADVPIEAKLANARFKRAAQRTIADDYELQIVAALSQSRHCLNQQELSLLLGQSANVDESHSAWRWGLYRGQEGLIQATMNDMDFPPIIQRAPPIKLTLRELADSHYESSVLNLALQAEGPGRVEFLGTVNCDAVRRPAENPTQKRDICRVSAKVSVKMLNTRLHKLSP
jgi:hypothetical protein